MSRIVVSLLAVAASACAPSVARRQCEYIKAGNLMPVAKRYNFAGYYDCQGDRALLPVRVEDQLYAGVFNFKANKVTHTLDSVAGPKPLPPGRWLLSQNSEYAVWIEQVLNAPIPMIGPRIRIYDLANRRTTEVELPKRDWKPEEAAAGTWQYVAWASTGKALVFDLMLKDEQAILNLSDGQFAIQKGRLKQGMPSN